MSRATFASSARRGSWLLLAAALVWAAPSSTRADDADVDLLDAGVVEVPDAALDQAAADVDAAVAAPPTDELEPQAPEEPTIPEGHAPEIQVRVIAPDDLATGDAVQLELTVSVLEGDDVNLPRQTYAPLELLGQDHTERLENGRRHFTFTLNLLALEPGELEIPGTTIRVITADGVVGLVHTDPQHITVRSLVANEPDAQPRPATEPVVVMQDDFTLLYVLGALALMAVTALVTWLVGRWWRRRPKALPPPPPPRPPWEVALAKLRALRGDLMGATADGSQARVVDGASDALREYLGHRYGFNGLESTTDEVITRLRPQRMQGASLAEITTLLGDCDLVKFAKMEPSQTDCERILADAERIVARTIPSVTAIAAAAPPIAADTPSVDPSVERRATRELAQPLPMPEPLPMPATSPGTTPAALASEATSRPVGAPSGLQMPVTNRPPPPEEGAPVELYRSIPETPVPPPPVEETTGEAVVPSATSLERTTEPGFATAASASSAGRAEQTLEAVEVRPIDASRSAETEEPSRPSVPAPVASVPAAAYLAQLAGRSAESEDDVWSRLDEAVASDGLVVGTASELRDDGLVVALGAGIEGVLPTAQLGPTDAAQRLVGAVRGYRVVSLNVARRRVVLSRRDVTPEAEASVLGGSS